jgi:Undecaprenyl-phosphate glucose phosphotransferase
MHLEHDSTAQEIPVRPEPLPLPIRQRRQISLPMLSSVLRALDLLAVVLVAAAVYIAYGVENLEFSSRYGAALVIAVLTAGVLFQWFDSYSKHQILARNLRVNRVLAAWGVAICVILGLAFALKISSFYSRVWAVSWFALTPAALITIRLVMARRIRGWVEEGRLAERVVIVGAGEQGQRLAERLSTHGDVHTQIVGLIDDRRTRVPATSSGYPVLGDVEHLISLIRHNMIDHVYIALPWSARNRLRELVHRLAVTPVHIRLAPDLAGFEFTGRAFSEVAGIPVLNVLDRPISGLDYGYKAIEDRVLGIGLLLACAPLMLLIALAIKLDSRGPVLFKQRRYGFNNDLIDVWKFRSMYTEQTDPNCVVQTTRNDPRVTRVGRFLRRSSLDELPQLFNVLRGDMSLVGPRPHAVETKAEGRLFEDVVDRYAARHKVKPGITGWAQVNGWRGETNTIDAIQKRVEHDLYYIDNWSVWLDLQILLRTVLVILRADKAY